MKVLVIFAVLGLHLPHMLVAFTATVGRIHDQHIFANLRRPIPVTIFDSHGSINEYDRDLETSALSSDSIKNVKQISTSVAISTIAGMFMFTPVVAFGVSGGGLDYANLDISSQNFSDGNYKGKDFTQVIAKATNFAGSNLQGCRFYKAYLVRADFSGADLRGASLEDTSMDEALLRNSIATGAYFSNSVMDAKDLENADFTDAQFPSKTLALLCQRDDVKGTNPTTGVDTRESLMCP